MGLLLATTSCMFRVNRRFATVPEHLYVPASSNQASLNMADASEEDCADCESRVRRRRLGEGL